MNFILQANMTPYGAAKRAQVDLSTMYRSRLYKLWRDGNTEELKRQLELEQGKAPKPRRPTKRERRL